MVRPRFFACAALAILAASTTGCRRHRGPRYADPNAVGAPMPAEGPPGAPPDGPPGPPPGTPPPGPPPGTPPYPGARPAPAPGTTRTLTATSAARSLGRVTHEPIDEVTPALSPNGTVVLFETRVGSGNQVTSQRIVGADPQSGGSRTHYSPQGAKSGAPAWLPDGAYVYVSDGGGGKPALVKALAAAPNAATATVVSADVAPDVTHPSSSPDGKHIAFEATLRGKTQIGVVGIDGSRLSIIGEGHRPTWSPDGKHIVFVRTVLDYSQIFVANHDGGGVSQVTSDASDHDDPSWAPSSKLIVFNSNKGFDRQGGSWNLFVVKPDGTGLLQITEGNSDTGAPSWGNDGWIYFDSNQSGNYQVWRLRPVGEIEAIGNRR